MTRRVWTVARREIQGFVDHPTAYILVVAFLALGLFLAFRTIYAMSTATLRPLFDLLPWLFAVFIPAVTMRSLAEERRSRTLEWLMAQPLGETEVVLGKFLGNWLFVLLALAGVLPAAVGVLALSEADPGIVVAQFAGASLLGAQMVAVGLWASSATRNQITAFILAAAVSLTLVLVGTPVVQIGLPPALGGALARLSVLGHFENVARGVIDLRDVLYFASTAGLFLLLAGTLLARERLSRSRASYRRLQAGTLALAGGVVVLNLLGGHVRGRVDLTRQNLYTLADGSRQILGGLDDIVTITLVVSSELPPEVQLTVRDVRDLLADFRRASDGRVRLAELNPERSDDAREEATSLGIYPIEFNVLRDNEFQVRRGWFGMAVRYADRQEVIPIVDRTDDLEYRLASAVSSMTRDTRPRLAFATGFGARGAFQFPSFQRALADRYDVRSVSLEGDSVPELGRDTLDVLVLAAPTQPLSPEAVEAIRGYVDAGGAALLLLEKSQLNPQMPTAVPVETGLEELLQEWGIGLRDGIVYDLRSSERISMGRQGIFSLVRSYPFWPVTFRGAEHSITRDLDNLTLGWAAPLEIGDAEGVVPLWQTTEFGGARPVGGSIAPDIELASDPDELGVQVVAAALDPGAALPGGAGGGGAPAGRMVVVGDADFLDEQFVRSNPQNLIFAANAVDWLAQDEALIRIRSKDRTPPALAFESDFQRNALKWGSLVGVPLLFALGGAGRVVTRQHRARRRWEEVVS